MTVIGKANKKILKNVGVNENSKFIWYCNNYPSKVLLFTETYTHTGSDDLYTIY